MMDLIDECGSELVKSNLLDTKENKYDLKVSNFSINTHRDEKKIGFDRGDYVIISSPFIHLLDEKCHDYIAMIMRKYLKAIFAKLHINRGEKVLLVGIGNPDILADSLGDKTLDKIEINTLRKNNNIFKIKPNIFASTGIDSFDMIHYLANCLKVNYVILIDSLATKNLNRLSSSIQINTSGLTPGSAIRKNGRKISKSTLGVPCIAIGVPLMFIAEGLGSDYKDLILTPKDIHEEINNLAYIISMALQGLI